MWHKILLSAVTLYAGMAWGGVDVNTADVAALDGIRGIGPSMSRKILLEREHAKFKNWADLLQRVPGIKRKIAEKFSAQGLTVDGESFTDPSKVPL
ncbi:ComEA family DNA-binding protein [Rhodoferax sp. WC2427]|uniref:ComEA family DNA-binding protein n=1 Tax=Rhodoferax sp. WC2427 TaxID=3234144 RepID=UPI003467CD54